MFIYAYEINIIFHKVKAKVMTLLVILKNSKKSFHFEVHTSQICYYFNLSEKPCNHPKVSQLLGY